MKVEFKNQKIIVTGGTRGIGEATAIAFLEAGAEMVVITGTSLSYTPSTLLSKYTNLYYEQANFLDDSLSVTMGKIVQKYGGFDVCVNNAGINIIRDITDFDSSDMEKVLKVNLVSPALVASIVSENMIKKKYGRIVNIASIFGEVSKEKRFNYTSSKAGLIGQTKSISLDLAKFGVLVNAVGPGFIGTELTRRVLGEAGIKEMTAQVPLERLGEPEEIANLILFLSSDKNTFITGQHIVADGGFLAK